jgi:hypothetical protein
MRRPFGLPTKEKPVNDTVNGDFDVATVAMALKDPNVSSLDINSEEFKSALGKYSAKETEPADADDVNPEDEEETIDKDASEEDDEQEEESEKPKSKEDKAAAKFRRLRQEAAQLKRENEELKANRAAPQEHAKEEQLEPTRDRPHRDDPQFASYDDYVEALTEWKAEQIEAKKEFKAQQKAQAEQSQKSESTWKERAAALSKELPDFDDVVTLEAARALKPSQEAAEYLYNETENGPRLAYELIEDEELGKKFANASPMKQIAILAKLDAQFDKPSEPAKKTVKALPDPPKKMPAGRNTMSYEDLMKSASTMDFNDWNKQYERSQRKRSRY